MDCLCHYLKCTYRTAHTGNYVRKVYIDCIDCRNVLDQPTENYIKTYGNIRKNSNGLGDDYTTGCLLVFTYFTQSYKLSAVDLSKRQALDADPKAKHQISFAGNLNGAANTIIFFIIEEPKELF